MLVKLTSASGEETRKKWFASFLSWLGSMPQPFFFLMRLKLSSATEEDMANTKPQEGNREREFESRFNTNATR